MELHRQDDDVDVVEEVEIHMGDLENNRRRLVVQHGPHSGDIPTAVDANRRLAIAGQCFAADALAIQKALYVRQKRDEFLVVPFLEIVGVAEFIFHFPPGTLIAHRLQQFPILRDVRLSHSGVHHLQGPEQDLAEMTDHGGSALRGFAHGVESSFVPLREGFILGIPC